jgi:hypothetical protein
MLKNSIFEQIASRNIKIFCNLEDLYIRTRWLIMPNWDKDNKIAEIMDKYLKKIEDIKPITARQCINDCL